MTARDPRKVFVVHGRDVGMLRAVYEWLVQIGLQPIILRDRPNRGRTLIEKLLDESKDVSYAIVLASRDDEGQLQGEPGLQPRPRQNVVLELGLFLGILGRGRIALLREYGVEFPSDYDGVAYIEWDAGGWRDKLAAEFADVGVEFAQRRVQVESPPAEALGEIWSGRIPQDGGFGLVVFGGGTSEQLVAAVGCTSERAAFWATAGGAFVTYVPRTNVSAVNAAWYALFPKGILPTGTAIIGRCA